MCITFFDHEHTQSMPLKSLPRRNHHHSFGFLNAYVHVHMNMSMLYACSVRTRKKNWNEKFKFTIFMAVAYGDDDGCWPLLIWLSRAFLISLSFHFPFRWVWLSAPTKRLMNWLWQMIKARRDRFRMRICWCRPGVDVALWLVCIEKVTNMRLPMPMFCIRSQSD